MRKLTRKDLLKFLSAFFAAVLLITFIPFDVIPVLAVQGNDTYEIYVYDDQNRNQLIEGAKVVLQTVGYQEGKDGFHATGTTDSSGAVVFNLKEYLEPRNWPNDEYDLYISVPGTGYEEYHNVIRPNKTDYAWQNDYNAYVIPTKLDINKILKTKELTYDGNLHKASEFFEILDSKVDIEYKDGKMPSFGDAGEYTFPVWVSGKGYYNSSDKTNPRKEYSITVSIAKGERTDFKFLNPDPDTLVFPKEDYFKNSINSSMDKKDITYKSSDPDIADVEPDGGVTFKQAGTVTITATMEASDNYLKSEDTYKISAKHKLNAHFVKSELKGTYGKPMPDNELKVTCPDFNLLPSYDVTYSLVGEGDDEIASINSKTGVVTPKKAGTVTVQALVDMGDAYFTTTAKYKLTITKGTRTLRNFTDLEMNQVYTMFNEALDVSKIDVTIVNGATYIRIDREKGTLTVWRGSGTFEMDVVVPETDQYYRFKATVVGNTVPTTQDVDFSNPMGYSLPVGDSDVYEIDLNGKPHYGSISATWDNIGTDESIIDSIYMRNPDDSSDNTVVVKFKKGKAGSIHDPINIEITFSGNDSYKEKTIKTQVGLVWDTSIPNQVQYSPKDPSSSGYYLGPVKVYTTEPGVTFLDPKGNRVDEYTLTDNGEYGMRTTYFYRKDGKGVTKTNTGSIKPIKIDQTAPTGFSVDITNPDNSKPLKKILAKFLTVFASKSLNVTVTVKDVDSGFSKIVYDLGDGQKHEVTEFTVDTPVTGSKEQVTGKFKIPVNKKTNLKVWAYDVAGNEISTHDDKGNLISGRLKIDGVAVEGTTPDVQVIVDDKAPEVKVTFDNNSAANERFFKNSRNVTIKVTEDNYDQDEVKINVKKDNVNVSKDELKKNYGLTYNKDDKTIKLSFTQDGVYTFDVSYTDHSGNVGNISYGSSAAPNSFVIDKVKPVVTVDLDYSDAQNQSYFSMTKSARIHITEKNYDYKDLDLDVQMTKDGKTETIKKDELKVMHSQNAQEYIVDIFFTVDADYDFKLGFKDLAGNVANIDYGGGDKFHFVIDTTLPEVNVSYSNNTVYNGKYFNKERTATISVTEHNFDKKATYIVVNKKQFTVDNWEKKGDTYATTYEFKGDDSYEFDIICSDKAGNKCPGIVFADDTTAPKSFVVDTTKPKDLSIKINGESVLGVTGDTSVTFNKFYKDAITIELDADCNISGTYALQYQLADKTNSYKIDANKWSTYDVNTGIKISNSRKFILYFRAIDFASNSTIVNSTGIIVDNKEPEGEKHAPDIDIVLSKTNDNGYYKDDVTAKISIVDPAFIGDERDPDGYYSGLKEVKYTIYTTDTDAKEEGVLLDTTNGIGYSDASFDEDKLAQKWTNSIVIDAEKFNSNNVIIQVEAVDNAGNIRVTRTKQGQIMIDTTKPRINVSYNNNNADLNEYFKADRVATISITERNFDPDNTVISLTSSTGKKPAISEWTKGSSHGNGNGDDTVWTATVTFNSDADYTFDITSTDLAGNEANPADYGNSVAPKKFTIDKTVPTINVKYDNNDAANKNYYKNFRTATITIVEHNFNADRVKVSVKATDNGSDIAAPTVSKWTTNGDTHTATIKYNKDGKFVFRISAKDKAGNDAANFAEQVFYIDTTAPALSITGVKDNSANRGNLAPQILYSDTNYSPDLVDISFSGANRGTLKLEGTNTPVANGNKFVFNEFAKNKDVDDIYTLSVTITDLAGNVTTQKITFSVNRFGSTYGMSDATKAVIGKYIKDPVDIVVSEVNPNDLVDSKVTLYKNNNPIVLNNGVDYDVKKTGGSGAWNEYTYTIHADNFKDDGVYSVYIYSVDEAGNTSENTLDTKNATLQFGVDNSEPNIVVSNLKDSTTYATELYTVKLLISDNLLLDGVDVYLDDYNNPYKSWTGEEVAAVVSEAGEFAFDIDDASNGSHKVKIVATDAAGNKHEIEVSNFYVTTNLFVRYYTNTPLFVGSIIGLLVVVALVIFIVVIKRKYGKR